MTAPTPVKNKHVHIIPLYHLRKIFDWGYASMVRERGFPAKLRNASAPALGNDAEVTLPE